jgi:ubiquinone/menaquinone biosynthesis C-methylase UbiE
MSYDKTFTDALQFVWGSGFLSPGGPKAVAGLLNGQDISGAKVLDIGSGLGGMDHVLVQAHGAGHVTGIDVDPWLVDQSRDLAAEQGLGDRVAFELVQPGPLPFADGAFDVVVSKDAMIHIPDKAAIYGEVMRVLAPGGRFLASDWLFGPGAATSPEIVVWLGDNPLGFAFTTPDEALAALRGTGFADPSVTSDSAAVEAIFVAELARLKSIPPDELVRLLGRQQATERVAGAAERLAAVRAGQLRPCLLLGRKAA